MDRLVRRLLTIHKHTPLFLTLGVVLSIAYELSFLEVIELKYIGYYTITDFLRSLLLWLPLHVLLIGGDFAIATFRNLNRQIAAMPSPDTTWRQSLGIHWSILKSVPRLFLRLGTWLIILGFVGLLFSSTIGGSIGNMLLIVVGFIQLAQLDQGFADHVAEAARGAASVNLGHLVLMYVVAISAACIWGAGAAHDAAKKVDDLRIELRRGDAGTPEVIQCKSLRHLSEVVIAICNGRSYVIKNSDIRIIGSVRQDIGR